MMRNRNILLPGEKVIFRTHPHWVLFVAPILAVSSLGGVLLTMLCPSALEMTLNSRCPVVLITSLTFVNAVVFLDWLNTIYYLTDRRLISKRGIIGKQVMVIPLKQVQDISLRISLIGRIFGYGDLVIESAGTEGKIEFVGMSLSLSRTALRYLDKSKNGTSNVTGIGNQ